MGLKLMKQLRAERKDKIINLSRTRKITDEDVEMHWYWASLKEDYKEEEKDENTEWLDKAILSFVNSIIYQQRIFCTITRKGLEQVFSSDKNRKEPIGLSKDKKNGKTYYQWFLHEARKRGIISLYDDSKKPFIYQVIQPEIVKMVMVDSPEEQLNQVIDFVNKNNKNNHQVGDQVGDQVIEYKNIRITEDKGEVSAVVSETKHSTSEKISLEKLLFKEYPENFPMFDDIEYLAQLAVENCTGFDGGITDKRVFEKHLKSLSGGKPTPKQKKFMEGLVEKFGFEAEKYIALVDSENLEVKQPKKITPKRTMPNKQDEKEIDIINQNNTLNTLLSSVDDSHLEKLKTAMENAKDEEVKQHYEIQIKQWKRIHYGQD